LVDFPAGSVSSPLAAAFGFLMNFFEERLVWTESRFSRGTFDLARSRACIGIRPLLAKAVLKEQLVLCVELVQL